MKYLEVSQVFLEPVSCHPHIIDRCYLARTHHEKTKTKKEHEKLNEVQMVCNKTCVYYSCLDKTLFLSSIDMATYLEERLNSNSNVKIDLASRPSLGRFG